MEKITSTKDLSAKDIKQLVETWKKEHGSVYLVEVEDYKCWLRKPKRRALSYASSIAAKDPIKFEELMLEECWLGGDEILKTDDDLFYAVATVLQQVIEQKKASIVKL